MCLKWCDHHIHAITIITLHQLHHCLIIPFISILHHFLRFMGRPPCCDKANVKKGIWTPEEDAKILAYVSNHGVGNWTQVPKKAGNSFIIVRPCLCHN